MPYIPHSHDITITSTGQYLWEIATGFYKLWEPLSHNNIVMAEMHKKIADGWMLFLTLYAA